MKFHYPSDRSHVWATPIFRPEQVESMDAMVEELSEGSLAVLQASDMGVGKTVTAAEAVYRLGLQRVLYVGIKHTFDDWEKTLSEQSDGAIVLRSMDGTKKGQQAFASFIAGEPGHYFSGSQYLSTQDWTQVPVLHKESGLRMLDRKKSTGELVIKRLTGIGPAVGPVWQTRRKQLNRYRKIRPVDLLVFDEVHMVGNKRSNGIGTVRSIPSVRRMGMSGTFYGNKFVNAHTVCRWLWPDEAHGIDPRTDFWISRWCETKAVYAPGGRLVTSVTGERNPGEFVKTLPCYIRLESSIGPAPEPEIVYVDLSPAEQRDYDQMEDESIFWLQSHAGLEPVLANLPVVQRMRLRSAALGTLSVDGTELFYNPETLQSAKEIKLAGVLRRPNWVGKQTLIYSEDKRFLRTLVTRMKRNGMSVALWSGDLSTTQRREMKRAYIAGEIQHLVAVISSIGTGTNGLQKACSRVIWVSESENANDNVQGIRRAWRDGGNLADFQHLKLIARNTIDEGVLARNAAATVRAMDTMRIAA